ncbi:alkane 1-monooxygenase [Lewinella sp. JB7]|uniref:alkane 1-monooxygenase n=1 Tax=Lewinella sp. JB7 TaxID=2962887 RepID=UPI0020CA1762|nr:alkane 1-monooxygenase [Lewinella sp. JB7]MCP9234640.1 alkane 1-monooxygenase [Lewinella sp. JB7]
MWRDYKYLLAYVIPLAGFLGVHFGGVWSPGSLYVAFLLLPLLELVLPARTGNPAPATETVRAANPFFDWLLYLNLPVLYGIIAYFLFTATTRDLSAWETAGMVGNVGLLIGTTGINVGHELGHRSRPFERWIAQALLLTGLYLHFYIEHNRGHHKHVATPRDPATSRRGESLYAFWVRSVVGGYLSAWRLDRAMMRRFTIVQLLYLATVAVGFGWSGLALAVGAGVFGFLMLETVNYLEHYGLLRHRNERGYYEPVRPVHSWNSDHELGRIVLYELTRHSDHHYKSTRKYQTLRRFEESPQLPTGYPGSMLLALVPPLWFSIMDRRLERYT